MLGHGVKCKLKLRYVIYKKIYAYFEFGTGDTQKNQLNVGSHDVNHHILFLIPFNTATQAFWKWKTL